MGTGIRRNCHAVMMVPHHGRGDMIKFADINRYTSVISQPHKKSFGAIARYSEMNPGYFDIRITLVIYD